MNEYKEPNLYEILDTQPTALVQLYYVACIDTDDEDGALVADSILYMRKQKDEREQTRKREAVSSNWR